jgi:prepilin-type N-terminal cleavage/methylation domain-containing protein
MKKIFKQKNNKRGFTLVEVLVAIAIFTMSVLSLMVILGGGISNTTYAKQKITGEYLAQEGIEYIRNMRDTYALYAVTDAPNGPGWASFRSKLLLASCDNTTNGCYFGDLAAADFTNHSNPITRIAITACSSGACPKLKYDPTAGYNNTTGTDSGFTRTLTITCPTPPNPPNDCSNSNEIKVTSDVSWTQGTGLYHAIFSENLFNWIQ